MTISTTYRRLETDTQGEHIEVHTVYTGNKEEIDALEKIARMSIGDGIVSVSPEGMEDSK